MRDDRCTYHCQWTGAVIEGDTPRGARWAWTVYLVATGRLDPRMGGIPMWEAMRASSI